MSAEFDKIAGSYEDWHSQIIKGSGFGREYFLEYKIKEMRRVIGDYQPKNILDFGCGVGDVDPYIQKYFPDAKIFGVDISRESINAAKEKNADVIYGVFGEGWFDQSFDLVFISNVFHHAPPSEHLAILAEIKSQMCKGAKIFIFEINPFNPATRHVFFKYEKPIDKNANLVSPLYLNKLLRRAGFKTSRNIYTIFFPKFLSFLLPLEKFLNFVPFGAHYYLHGEV
jgi:SAM-dependent methyltransferase